MLGFEGFDRSEGLLDLWVGVRRDRVAGVSRFDELVDDERHFIGDGFRGSVTVGLELSGGGELLLLLELDSDLAVLDGGRLDTRRTARGGFRLEAVFPIGGASL